MNRVQSKILIVLGILYAVFSLLMVKFFGSYNLIMVFISLIVVVLGVYWYLKSPNIPTTERTKDDYDDFVRRANIPGYIQYKYAGERKGLAIFALSISMLVLCALFLCASIYMHNPNDFDNYNPIDRYNLIFYSFVGFYFFYFWSIIDVSVYRNRMNMSDELNFWDRGSIKNTKRAKMILILFTILALIGLTILTFT